MAITKLRHRRERVRSGFVFDSGSMSRYKSSAELPARFRDWAFAAPAFGSPLPVDLEARAGWSRSFAPAGAMSRATPERRTAPIRSPAGAQPTRPGSLPSENRQPVPRFARSSCWRRRPGDAAPCPDGLADQIRRIKLAGADPWLGTTPVTACVHRVREWPCRTGQSATGAKLSDISTRAPWMSRNRCGSTISAHLRTPTQTVRLSNFGGCCVVGSSESARESRRLASGRPSGLRGGCCARRERQCVAFLRADLVE